MEAKKPPNHDGHKSGDRKMAHEGFDKNLEYNDLEKPADAGLGGPALGAR